MLGVYFFNILAELLGLSEPTVAADWWSLGAVLFEILTGKVGNFNNCVTSTNSLPKFLSTSSLVLSQSINSDASLYVCF